MYDEILLPFDGSEGADAVLEHVAAIAGWADATVHVLHVADTSRDSVTVVGGEVVDALEARGEGLVERATDTLESRGVETESEVLQGNPAPTIVDYAETYGLDLVVLATHGREGVSRFLLGSVAEKVVRLCDVPVLSARTQPDERLRFPYERLLVPTDGSEAATQAIEHAMGLAAGLDAAVEAISVVDDSFATEAEREAAETAAEEALGAVRETGENAGVDAVETSIRHGRPIDAILEELDGGGHDAVVMGTRGRRGTERVLLGSVAERTVRAAPVPVLTVAERD